METIDTVKIERLKKLLNKAQSAKEIGSLEEANAFSAKISKLLLELNISMSELEEHTIDGVSELDGVEYNKQNGKTWSIQLANTLAQFNFCKILFNHYSFRIIGKKENIVQVEQMFNTLQDNFLRLASLNYTETIQAIRDRLGMELEESTDKEVVALTFSNVVFEQKIAASDIVIDYTKPKKDGKRWFTIKDPSKIGLSSSRGVFLRNFLEGAVFGLHSQLKEQELLNKKEFGSELVIGLVLVQNKDNDNYVKEKHPNTIKSTLETASTKDLAAFNKGYETGKGISLNKTLN